MDGVEVGDRVLRPDRGIGAMVVSEPHFRLHERGPNARVLLRVATDHVMAGDRPGRRCKATVIIPAVERRRDLGGATALIASGRVPP